MNVGDGRKGGVLGFREQPCFDVQKVEEIKRKLLLVLPLLPLLLLSSFFFIFVCVF